MNHSFFKLISFLLLLVSCNDSQAQFKPAKIFGEHMVLQRNEPIKIWGTGTPDKKMVATFNGSAYQVVIDASGFWEFEIPAQKAGGPYKMLLSTARKKIEWSDIYVGDVWLCSGQSNMEWVLEMTDGAEAEIAQVNDSLIRQFKVPRTSADELANDIEGGAWINSSKETVGNFTAVGYYFAKKIRTSGEGVAIGLLNSSWGGSRIEPWMDAASLGASDTKEIIAAANLEKEKNMQRLDQKLVKIFPGFKRAEKIGEEKKVNWETFDFDDSKWPQMAINGNWENEGYEFLDGMFWYRNTFELTKAQAKENYTLELGMIDDSDWTYVNGTLVGQMALSYNVPRSYSIDKKLLKPGKNVIAIRVEDTGGGGGINASQGAIGLRSKTGFIDLFTNWKVYLESLYPVTNFARNAIPTVLYNKMIYPLRDFPIKGVLWYQGESNADQNREEYGKLFKGLINNWRTLWGNENLPFYFVQLAAFTEAPSEPEYSSWPNIRMAQADALALDHTGMAVTIDIGDANDIHPRNKKDVGERLALIALDNVYGKRNNFRGPNPKRISIFEGKLIVEYNNAEGIYFRDNNLSEKQFSVAGANGKFYWAKPILDAGRVILNCPNVSDPVEVRYAWAANPAEASLFNADNLPAEPFSMKITE